MHWDHIRVFQKQALYMLAFHLYLRSIKQSLKTFFLFALFNSLDRQVFSNSIVFSKVIEQLNNLNEFGIDIELPSGTTK